MNMSPNRTDRHDRGQTSLDFLIGIGVFMLTVAFVVGAIPGLIEPFSGGQETPLVADRITSEVVGGMMVDAGRSSALNETCTYAFFDDSFGDGDACALSFDASDDDLPERLGIDDGYSVNVTIQRDVTGDADREVLCTDGETVGECGTLAGSERLAIGPPPANLRSVVSTRRTAYLDGKDVTVVVKVW